MEIKKLKELFIKKYGEGNINVYFSPGRVNLIGEHTDYNGGYVLPCALSFGTYLLVRKNNENVVRFSSTNLPLYKEVPIDKITVKIEGDAWMNYPMGIAEQFKKKGVSVEGMDMLYAGNIPNGAGLSSSASVEVVTSVAFNDLYNANIDMVEMVEMSQKAENEFIGVNCGIMDQFAVGMGKKDHALALQCDSMKWKAVPIVLDGYKIVIANTNKRRGLADSKYNERRSECEKAVEYIKKEKDINLLGELSAEEFSKVENLIPDETIRRRAKHVVTENQRVIDAMQALENNNLVEFGKLMNQSHDSLQHDYEVTGIELDTLVEEARKISGVLGSRMTGAGFGGCTVSIVKEENIDKFKKEVGENYKKRVNLEAEFYIADIGKGAYRIE